MASVVKTTTRIEAFRDRFEKKDASGRNGWNDGDDRQALVMKVLNTMSDDLNVQFNGQGAIDPDRVTGIATEISAPDLKLRDGRFLVEVSGSRGDPRGEFFITRCKINSYRKDSSVPRLYVLVYGHGDEPRLIVLVRPDLTNVNQKQKDLTYKNGGSDSFYVYTENDPGVTVIRTMADLRKVKTELLAELGLENKKATPGTANWIPEQIKLTKLTTEPAMHIEMPTIKPQSTTNQGPRITPAMINRLRDGLRQTSFVRAPEALEWNEDGSLILSNRPARAPVQNQLNLGA